MIERRLDFAHTVDDWARSLAAANVRPRTIDSYRRTLYATIDLLGPSTDPRTLVVDDYERVLAYWQPLVAANTLRNRAMAIRAFDAWLAVRRGGRGEARKPAGHSQLGRIVKALAAAAGIVDFDAITPHMFRRWALEAFIAQTGDLHSAAELAGHRDVNQTRRYAGRAKIARVRGGVAAIEAATAALSEQPGWAANPRRDPSSGRTWVRTRDASSEGDDSPPGAAGGEVGA